MKEIFVRILFLLAHVLNCFIFSDNSLYSCSSNVTKILQNWGNYVDMSQAVIIYVMFASDVLLICWFGTQLTQHVRDNYVFYSRDVTKIMGRNIKELGNLTHIQQSVIFSTIWPSVAILNVRI